MTDELTELLNRRGFYEKAGELQERAQKFSQTLFVIYMDLNDFKKINDNFGHTVGDEALREMGAFLKSFFGDERILARLGGDEFVVLGVAEDDEQFGFSLLERFRRALAERNAHTVRPYLLDPSLGMAQGKEEMGDVELLVRWADDAMYEEKAAMHLRRLRKERGNRPVISPEA